MKAKLTGSEETQKFTLEVPMEEFLHAVLGKERRDRFRDCTVDVWGDSRRHTPNDEPDQSITITFYKSREFKRNADGELEETPKKPSDPFVKKSELSLLEARLEGLALDVKDRQP